MSSCARCTGCLVRESEWFRCLNCGWRKFDPYKPEYPNLEVDDEDNILSALSRALNTKR